MNAIVDEPRLGVAEGCETRPVNFIPSGETPLSFGNSTLVIERLPLRLTVLPERLLLLPLEAALMLAIARLLTFETTLTFHGSCLLALEPTLTIDVTSLLTLEPALALNVSGLLALDAQGLLLGFGRAKLLAFNPHLRCGEPAAAMAMTAAVRGGRATAAAVIAAIAVLLGSGLAAAIAAAVAPATAGLRCSRGRDRESGDTCGEE